MVERKRFDKPFQEKRVADGKIEKKNLSLRKKRSRKKTRYELALGGRTFFLLKMPPEEVCYNANSKNCRRCFEDCDLAGREK